MASNKNSSPFCGARRPRTPITISFCAMPNSSRIASRSLEILGAPWKFRCEPSLFYLAALCVDAEPNPDGSRLRL